MTKRSNPCEECLSSDCLFIAVGLTNMSITTLTACLPELQETKQYSEVR